MSSPLLMPSLYKRLRRELKLTKGYVCQQLLPDWWEAELDHDPAATLDL